MKGEKDKMKTYARTLDGMGNARENDGYETFLAGIERKFLDAVNEGKEPIFTTDARDLWRMFMAGLPFEAKQHYNCRACRTFVERYGGLVRVNRNTGALVPIMWDGVVPVFFTKAVANMEYRVKRSNITGVFVTSEAELGTRRTNGWHHMAVEVPLPMRYRSKVTSAQQEAARLKEDYRALTEAMRAYDTGDIKRALAFLHSGELLRADKFIPWAGWFLNLKEKAMNRVSNLDSFVWLTVAAAPAGYCHIKGSALGALLDDVADRRSTPRIREAHNARVDPLNYMRPKAAPTTQNVQRAEDIVERLGLARSLERRFARLDELPKMWTPEKKAAKTGVFAALLPGKEETRTGVDVDRAQTITWAKFAKTVLPMAQEIEVGLVSAEKYNLGAMVTARYLSAPPIIRWDKKGERNPLSWYVYAGGSSPRDWGLSSGWVKVTAITPRPDGADSVMLVLDGAKDQRHRTAGSALFPEILIPELREVRATIEAHSAKSPLYGFSDSNACGVLLPAADGSIHLTVRVRTRYGLEKYHIDRWD